MDHLVDDSKMPYLVDTHIPADMDFLSEKEAVKVKISKYNLDPSQVLYNLDRINSVKNLPVWIDHDIQDR